MHTKFLFLDLLCSLDLAAMGTDETVECGLVVEDIRIQEQFGIPSKVSNKRVDSLSFHLNLGSNPLVVSQKN